MRKVIVSRTVQNKIVELKDYLTRELKLSEEAAMKRVDRMTVFLLSLGAPADYALCRFKEWKKLGYRCAAFEKSWVFAYEAVPEGVIIRDMRPAKSLTE